MKKRIGKNRMLLLFAAVTLLCGVVGAAPSGELLQQALYAEEIEGDLPSAIASYEKIIADPSAPANHVAQALYRQGMCYVRLKDEAKAAAALTRLVNDYSAQANLVEKARPVLEKLQLFDPATLMPPDTFVYLELGNPGKQIETLLGLLKDTPYANPLTMLSQLDAGSPGPGKMLFNFFNPSMLAEFKKIRSYAVGISDVATTGTSPFLLVLHPGESDALRGMILAGLGMAGMPGEPIEGMSTLLIQGEINVAYDDKVIIMAYPMEQLVWCIKQYKGTASEPSLATSNPSFVKLDKVQRNQNAATLWINVDDLHARIQELPHPPGEIQEINAMLNLASIDDLVISHAVEPDGLNLDGIAHFKEGVPNMAYELVRTPKAGSAVLKAVPPNAFYLMNFSLAGGAGSMQAAQLRTLIQARTGMDVGPQTLEGVEQIALFALPVEGTPAPDGMPFRPGVAIACRNPEQVVQMLGQMLAESLPEGGFSIKQAAGGVVLLSSEQSVVDACTSSLLGNASVLNDGPLSGYVESILPESNKMILMNGAGLLRLIGQRFNWPELDEAQRQEFAANYEMLAEQFAGTTLIACTDEQQKTLSLSVSLSGIPPLSQVLGPLTEVQKSIAEMEDLQARAEAAIWDARIDQLGSKPVAKVVNCTTPPVIDGELDEVWRGAEVYVLTNTIYVRSGPDSEIAANYRMLWDMDKLYVLIDVTDSSPVNDPTHGWQFSDGIEFYLDIIDEQQSNYGFGFVWDEDPSKLRIVQSHGRQIEKALSTAMKNTEKGYCFEASLPWSELGATTVAGTRIGVEVQVNDNRGRGHRDAKISWHDPYDKSWLDPRYFGRAELVASKTEQE